ncbi:MAG: hypothetical protein QM534_16230, partial [Sediminibacterium sp.]|nr:hypothetical protein [Sediminibacterium sp.]
MKRNYFLKLLALGLIWCLTITTFTAQTKTPKVNFRYNASATTKQLYLRDNPPPSVFACNKPRPVSNLRKAMLYAIANWKGDYDGSNTQFTINLTIKAYPNFNNSGTPLATYIKSLVIKKEVPQSYVAIDITGLHSSANLIEVTVSHVTSGSANPTIQNQIQTDVYFTEEFDYDVAYDAINPMFENASCNITGNEATFNWSGCGTPAPNFQFQLLRLYNTDQVKTTNESDITTLVDWDKALTIETGNSLQEITLTMAEGTGYYLWRVRPIGNAYEGGIANYRNWGVWSVTGVYTQGNAYAITNNLSATQQLTPHLFYYAQPNSEENRNWMFNRSFIEGDALNKGQVSIGEGISYANGLLMTQQTQAKIASEDKILANQVIYDYSGRPALNAMGAPVNKPQLGYISNYIRNANANTYSAADFDANSNFNNPGLFDTTATDGPGRYYSNLNTLEEEVPSANGLPFSRTLYMRDGTSKPKEQSGPGKTFKLGNTGNDRHTTRNYNSGVAPIELITIFGDEAPEATSVYKTITTDANNQSSVTYISKEGQTIASCLSGPGASNLDPLPSQPANPLMIDYFLDNNSAYDNNKGLIASKNIVLTEPTSVKISYALTPGAFSDNCNAFCATCDYRVRIKIINNDDPGATPITALDKLVNPTSGTSGCSGTAVTDPNLPYTVLLQPGAYTIERIIEAYQANPNGDLTATPVAIQPGITHVDQYLIKLENAIRNNFNSGTAIIVNDAGIPTGAPAVSMSSLWSFLTTPFGQQPDMNGLYALLNIDPNNSPDHVNIKINCDVITIPIKTCPTESCPVNNDFEKYLQDWCSAKGLSYTTVASIIIPGYSTGEFNTVIANMIDPSCGNYNCELLFQCWKSTINSYESLQGLAGTPLAASGAGMSMPSGNYTPDYLDLFLTCAGYKIKGISNAVGGSGCNNPGYKFHPYAYFKYTNGACTSCEQLFYTLVNGSLNGYPPSPDFITYLNSFTAVPFTINVNNSMGSVTMYPKEDFMKCTRFCNAAGVNTANINTSESAIETQCKSTCEGRYSEFVNQLIQTYHKAGKYIEGDSYELAWNSNTNQYAFNTTPRSYLSGPYTILEDIYCQAQKLVVACQSNCALSVVTSNGQQQLGTATEHQAMANAMYGAYELALPDNANNCAPGFSKTPALSGSNMNIVQSAVAALNQQLGIQRQSAPSTGFYWNYKSFLDADFSTYFSGKGGCGANTQVFIHPNIPSYFDVELISGTTYRLVYYFNKQSAGLSGISPKPLYSVGLISSGNGFIYASTINETAGAAEIAQLQNNTSAYVIGTGFSPANITSGSFSALNSNSNGGNYTASSSLYKYQQGTGGAYAYYKIELCNDMRAGALLSCGDICYKISTPQVITSSSSLFQQEGILFQQITCAQQTASEMATSINNQIGSIIEQNKARLRSLYQQTCIGQLTDEVKISYGIKYHHYTLFYYDRAGNLLRTVPPAGVVTGATNRQTHPAHKMVSRYAYNSLAQLIWQETPDGGQSSFWYDIKGRLRFSQNAKQAMPAENKMSYVKYDELGRTWEAGVMPASSNPVLDMENSNYPLTNTTEVIRTMYSSPESSAKYFGGKPQRYLQNRVSYVTSDKDGNFSDKKDQVSTYYSYDPHGNVEWLIQDLPDLGRNYTAYEYDLISGSVIQVKYNEGFADRFFHRYSYDTDKRLKTAETSKDGVYWEREAGYTYYLHGPLKRAEIGHDNIQGMDYVYTINGWIKAMNHVDAAGDLGKDGNETGRAYMPKDIYSMHLNYFEGDFNSKQSVYNSVSANPFHLSAEAGRNLYNGNISTWTSRFDKEAMDAVGAPLSGFIDKGYVTGRRFRYDELNRLKTAQYMVKNPGWASTLNYAENFTYDANGNIMNVSRKGYGTTDAERKMDEMTYNYYSSNTNQLRNVSDIGDNSIPTRYDDIKNHTSINNYVYDPIGNLTKDEREGITNIEWLANGKVSKITKSNQVIEFLYDAMGHRVLKKVYDPTATDQQLATTTTYYALDAQGNPMAIYKRTNSGTSPNYTAKFDLQEQPIYGSKRIGERSLSNSLFRTVNYTSGAPVAAQNLPAPKHISAWPNISVPLSNTTSKQLYTRKLNSNSTTNVVSDLGGNEQVTTEPTSALIAHNRNQAMLMDESGNVILSGYVYQKSTTGTTGYPRLYAYSNTLLTNSDLINASPLAQSLFVKKPGSEGEYYYITIGTDGKPYYHIVDISGAVVSMYNQVMDNNSGYGQTMAVIDDRVGNGPSVLYLRRLAGGTTTIKLFEVSANGILPLPDGPSFASDASGAEGEFRISPDASKLCIANITGGAGELKVYGLSSDHQTLTNLGRLLMSAATSARYAEFTANGTRIYFTERTPASNTSKVYYVNSSVFSGSAVNLSISSASLVHNSTAGITGALRRGSNTNIYYTTNTTAVPTTLNVYMITTPEATPAVGAANAISSVLSGGSLPAQTHVIDYLLPSEQAPVLNRTYNQKVYEVNDHLGNVHATVMDYKLPVSNTDVKWDKRFDNISTP